MVEKRSGRLETFSSKKMAQAVSRAGTPYALALEIARAIKTSKSLSEKDQISSATLRKMVAEELRKRGRQDIAKSYSGYKKSKKKVVHSAKHKSKVHRTTKSHAKHSVMTKDIHRGRRTHR